MNAVPPLTALDQLPSQLAVNGWAVLSAADLGRLSDWSSSKVPDWSVFWNDLPNDQHLRDGGRYRRRRHACYELEAGHVQATAHRAHWQPVEYNALHGGIERWFDPVQAALQSDPAWLGLLNGLAQIAGQLRPATRWFAEAHVFRINTEGGIGRPTPEGAHRDGVDLVAVLLLARQNIKGGETRVFDAQGTQGVRFTLDQPYSVLLLDDERVIHESTPIQPLDPAAPAWRDTLVITLRRGGFQGP